MKVHYGYKGLGIGNPVVTMGIFDGVHLGHRSLISSLTSIALAEQRETALITFHPHPRHVLDRTSGKPLLITTLSEKAELLQHLGLDHFIIIGFDEEFSRIRACDFVEEILIREIGTDYLVVGYDHQFGYLAEGNFDTIAQCAGLMNFKVEKVHALDDGEGIISSSMIREALNRGDLRHANRLLGYPYSIQGTVVEGKKLGRELGFPTANIEPSEINKLIPASGVYAVEVILDEVKFKGMLSIGTNPTFEPERTHRSVEVHILGFNGNIYGKDLRIILRHRMRDEKKFSGREELSKVMKEDMENANKLLE